MATDLVEINQDDPQPEALERAAAAVRRGRVVAIPTDALYTLVVAVLRACGGVSADVPAALPAAMAARHRACTALAAAVREAGYAADMGYNQLLYPNERDT